MALVKFVPPPLVRGRKLAGYPFKKDEACVFLGEIPNMPGHCVVVARKTGKIYFGYHTDSFTELTVDEV